MHLISIDQVRLNGATFLLSDLVEAAVEALKAGDVLGWLFSCGSWPAPRKSARIEVESVTARRRTDAAEQV